MSGHIELHVHLEGSLRPARLRALASAYGRPEVPRLCLNGDGDAFRPLAGFADFLELYKAATSVLRTPADHHAVALDLASGYADQGVTYAEVTVSYGVLQRRGLDPLPIQQALAEASDEARVRHGVHLRWQPDAARQWGVDAAWRVLEAAAKAGRDLGVVAFGLGGDEGALPAADFAAVFVDARREGLGTTCHAGETGGPDAVREAVEVCGVTRIGHALGAARDPGVLALMAERGVHAELCPGSNVATGVLARWDAHPLRDFLAAGVGCSLNTDDPTMFATQLRREYERACADFGLTDAEVSEMKKAARGAAFDPALAEEG